MQKSTKAALYSAFVFPGVGLFWLKQYGRGSIFFIPALIATLYIMNGLLLVSGELNAKAALNPEIYLDVTFLVSAITSSIVKNIPYLVQAKWFFITAWLLSIASSYFVGLSQDKKKVD
ncbi:MAG: hypothetical protein V4660_07120 [Pseudomonadota bacterium]